MGHHETEDPQEERRRDGDAQRSGDTIGAGGIDEREVRDDSEDEERMPGEPLRIDQGELPEGCNRVHTWRLGKGDAHDTASIAVLSAGSPTSSR